MLPESVEICSETFRRQTNRSFYCVEFQTIDIGLYSFTNDFLNPFLSGLVGCIINGLRKYTSNILY
jgi:hypothetical protein